MPEWLRTDYPTRWPAILFAGRGLSRVDESRVCNNISNPGHGTFLPYSRMGDEARQIDKVEWADTLEPEPATALQIMAWTMTVPPPARQLVEASMPADSDSLPGSASHAATRGAGRLRRRRGDSLASLVVTSPWSAIAAASIALSCAGGGVPPDSAPGPEMPPPDAGGACRVKELKKSEIQGVKTVSADGTRFLVNKEDEEGIGQVYVGTKGSSRLSCLTCIERPGGPKVDRYKMQPHWHPSGEWVFMAVEREEYSPPPILKWSKDYVEGQLQCGLWTNMYAVSSDGARWHRLTDFESGVPGVPDGYTGPVFTPDGKRAAWSQIVDGNTLRYRPFGRWELILADFEVEDGVPKMVNQKDITPEGMHWNEIGNFAPDNASLLLSGSVEKDAQGMDQYILNIDTGELTNLTNSPKVWDEHGLFSPDGEKIIFMSAHPYRDKPLTSTIFFIKTEFMLMNKDGSGLTRLTHFMEPGYPEYSRRGIAGAPEWDHDGQTVNLSRLFFPDFEYWDLVFEGPCGRRDLLPD